MKLTTTICLDTTETSGHGYYYSNYRDQAITTFEIDLGNSPEEITVTEHPRKGGHILKQRPFRKLLAETIQAELPQVTMEVDGKPVDPTKDYDAWQQSIAQLARVLEIYNPGGGRITIKE